MKQMENSELYRIKEIVDREVKEREAEVTRLTEFSKKVWKLLSEQEKETCYTNCGTIGFIEDCCNILYIDISRLGFAQIEWLATDNLGI